MVTFRWLAVMLLVAAGGAQAGGQVADPGMAPLGQLVGRWSIEMEIRDPEGNWNPQPGHRVWHWYYILDGEAIQDDFITTLLDGDGNEAGREIGTNIRIYNPEEGQWHMAWIHSARKRLATFTAVNQGGNVIMRGVNDRGREVRNTFFDIANDRFEWVQEWTFDEGATWAPVARIHATRLE